LGILLYSAAHKELGWRDFTAKVAKNAKKKTGG